MTTVDPLEELFAPVPVGQAQPMMYRQGVLLEWNPATLQNRVLVQGSEFVDLPLLGVAETVTFTVGSVLGVMSVGETWAILGRFVTPNTPAAEESVSILATKIHADTVADFEGTASSTYTDLSTTGPTVTLDVGPSGRVVVFVGARIVCQPAEIGFMGFEITGPLGTNPPTDLRAVEQGEDVIGTNMMGFELEGATPGSYTFTAKYRVIGGTTVSFSNRTLMVIAL